MTETPTSWDFVVLFLTFCLFAISLVAWGRLISKSESFLDCWIFGTAFALITPQIISVTQLLNHSGLAIAFVLLPLPALLKLKRPTWPALNNLEKILFAAFCLLVFCRFFEASLLQPHGDPLYYDLLSAAKWRSAGQIQFFPELPLLFQSNWWDYIYLWPAMFFQTGPSLGLVQTQIFGQWLHFFVAFCGSLLVWNSILKELNYDRYARGVSTLALSACSSVWWTATIAKNDWGAIFLLLAGVYYLQRTRLFAGGALLGLAMASKMTIVSFLLPLLVWFTYKNKKLILPLLAGMALAMLPIALRNYVYTGSPLFPDTFGAGKEFLSQSFLEYIYKYTSGVTKENWQDILRVRSMFVFESPFVLIGLAAALYGLFKSKRDFVSNIYFLALVGFFIFIFISGPWAENRLYGPGLVLLAGSGAALVASYNNSYLRWALLILVLATSKIPTFMPKKFLDEFPPALERMNSGDLKIEIQKNIQPGTKIVTSGDNELYYLSAYEITDVLNNPVLDKAVRGSTDTRSALKSVRAAGYKYLLHTTRYDGHCWEGLCEKLQADLLQFESAIFLRGKIGVVLDLDRVE